MIRITRPDPRRSMSWEEDGLYEATAAASHATLYTVTDYSGSGILFAVGTRVATGFQYCYIQITSDGNVHAWDCNSVNAATAGAFQQSQYGGASLDLRIPLALEFRDSLKVEVGNDHTSSGTLFGQTSYGIDSEEIERRIIPAGEALPDRDYVYAQDVMAVFFRSVGRRITNKLEFLSSPQVHLSTDAEGNVTGQLKQMAFNAKVGEARKVWTDLKEDREEIITLDGKQYKVPIVGGKLERGLITTAKAAEIVDLTAATAEATS